MLLDMVGKLQLPNVALVHQLPFTSDNPGFSAAVEKVSMKKLCFNYFLQALYNQHMYLYTRHSLRVYYAYNSMKMSA